MEFIRNLLSNSKPAGYDSLRAEKDDDEWDPEEMQTWLDTHPIDSEMYKLAEEKIRICVIQFLKEFPCPRVTRSNIEPVKNYFRKFAMTSQRTRRCLLEETRKLKNIDFELRTEIVDAVRGVWTEIS